VKVTDANGNDLEKVVVRLTVGEAKWLLDSLEDQLDDYPDASDDVSDDIVKLQFTTGGSPISPLSRSDAASGGTRGTA
jgi:hypothetical protein